MVSLNKAKKLYSEGKPFEPNLDEFIEALNYYSEVQFKYNNIFYGVILTDNNNNEVIELFEFDSEISQIFKTEGDFKNNAKVEGKLLKDIWNDTTDRYWLQ